MVEKLIINGRQLVRYDFLPALKSFGVLVYICLLAGCVSAPLKTDSVNSQITPLEVVNAKEASDDTAENTAESQVAWGGVVVNSANVASGTQLEILSYPLDRLQRPNTNLVATGRFIVAHEEYLETLDYAPGRFVTVVGKISGTQEGTIGEATYVYPTLAAQQIHLWSDSDYYNDSGIRFGIGINISN